MTNIELAEDARRIYGTLMMTEEMPWALDNLNALLPTGNGFIEIGSAFGASFHCWASVIKTGPAISVDAIAGWATSNMMIEYRETTWKQHFGDRVQSILGYSQDLKNINKVAAVLNNEQVDFLFIDGDHSYEAVKADYENYRPFVRKGGIIGFHDIKHHGHKDGSVKFWKELTGTKYEMKKHWTSIGLLVNE